MKKIFALAATAIIALASPTPAKADTVPGWYTGVGAIATFPTDADTSVGGVDQTVSYNTGWGILGDAGYAWSQGFRVEGELSENRANVDQVHGAGGSGVVNNFDFLGNLFYDFQTGSRWTPYIGGGIGFASVDGNHIGTLSNGGSLNDSSLEFAYQGIVGVAYEIADHWAVTTDYRYIRTTDPTWKTTAGGTAQTENASHNFVIGVRYTMHSPERPAPKLEEAAAPQPTPRPAPAVPQVPQSYMVFFDFDKAELTPEAQHILASAAEDFKNGGYVRIVVTGHTDTVGTVPYNQKLSERRADAVEKELSKLGVDVKEIGAVGVGKSGLLVPTADQIREAKNRRAEIVFSKPQ